MNSKKETHKDEENNESKTKNHSQDEDDLPLERKHFVSQQPEDYAVEMPEESYKQCISIINNYPLGFYTDRIDRTEEIIRKFFPNLLIHRMHFADLNYQELNHSAGVILTGSSYNVSHFYENKQLRESFRPVINYIKDHPNKPILGVCYGFHLVAYAFDAKINRMHNIRSGNRILHLTLKRIDELIPYKEINVNVFHRDYVTPDDLELQSNFEIMATYTRKGHHTVQYMRHWDRPLFAVQFHPETHRLDYTYSDRYEIEEIHSTRLFGEEVLKNFIILGQQFHPLKQKKIENLKNR